MNLVRFHPEAEAEMAEAAAWYEKQQANGTIDHNLTTLVNAAPVWQAHRSHLYQRLVQSGWSHARVAGVVAAFEAFAGRDARSNKLGAGRSMAKG